MKSPLEKQGESDEERIKRLLSFGSIQECVIEANYWVAGYIREDWDLEPLSVATELLTRAQQLLGGL